MGGDHGVGKTALISRFLEDRFPTEYNYTIGVNLFNKIIEVEGNRCDLRIWDLGGEERFRLLLINFVTGASGAILMFDLTHPKSFYNLEEWIKILRKDNLDLPIILVGTKSDRRESLELDDQIVLEFVEQYNISYYIKISSKLGENVDKTFEILTREIIKQNIQK